MTTVERRMELGLAGVRAAHLFPRHQADRFRKTCDAARTGDSGQAASSSLISPAPNTN
jgi:hypothetical protein